MPRLKPTTKLDVIGNLALNPEKVAAEYTESKQQNKLYVKPPKWDSAGGGIELLAIENDREHKEMLQLQGEMLDQTKRQGTINENRIEELYKMHSQCRERFIEATNFFKYCDDMRKGAEVKVAEEKRLHAELRQSIQKYKDDIKALSEFRDTLKGTVKEYEPYEMVINQVVNELGIFSSVKDCTDRCDALMMTQEEITSLNKQKLQEIEDLRLKMIKISSEAAINVLGLNNELARLERAYVKASGDCLKWEKILSQTKRCLLEQEGTKIIIIDEIQNMYRLLCKHRGITPILRRNDIEQMMDFIRDEIQILQQVVKECTKK